jgi:hypothetical protein
MLRDQGGGPDSFLLEFTPEFTKDFLGAKDMYVDISPVPTLVYLRESTVNWVRSDTFLIPEIVYDPSLIFSPHVVLGGIIFADEAFAAPNLMTPARELLAISVLLAAPAHAFRRLFRLHS